MLLILFCVFGLLSFFPPPSTFGLCIFVLKRLTILSLKPPTNFVIGPGIQLINQSFEVTLIGFIFFIFLLKLIHIICSHDSLIKNGSSIFLFIFNSLPFNSIKSFSYSKRLCRFFWFYNLDFPSLYIKEKKIKFFENKNQVISNDFKRFVKYSYKLHNSYNLYKLPT